MARILIIDDDVPFCRGLADAMTVGGNEATCAHTLAEGKRLAAAEPFEVVFLDVILPDGSGLDAIPDIAPSFRSRRSSSSRAVEPRTARNSR